MRLGATKTRLAYAGLSVWVSAAALLACGSRVEPDPGTPSPDQRSASGGQDTSESSTGQADTSTDGPSPPDLAPDLPLGECVPGWSVGEADCPYLGSDQRCYATKEDACSCLCPRNGSSLCLSGFPGGPDGQTRVSCD